MLLLNRKKANVKQLGPNEIILEKQKRRKGQREKLETADQVWKIILKTENRMVINRMKIMITAAKTKEHRRRQQKQTIECTKEKSYA